MSEQPFEDVEDVPDPTDTEGPTFEQVEDKVGDRQDNWNADDEAPEVEDDEETPA